MFFYVIFSVDGCYSVGTAVEGTKGKTGSTIKLHYKPSQQYRKANFGVTRCNRFLLDNRAVAQEFIGLLRNCNVYCLVQRGPRITAP
jgi:hypothetical protein